MREVNWLLLQLVRDRASSTHSVFRDWIYIADERKSSAFGDILIERRIYQKYAKSRLQFQITECTQAGTTVSVSTAEWDSSMFSSPDGKA